MHDWDWDDLRTFLAAAREGSFTGAARALKLQQSTVSRRIARLEDEIGQPLFRRTRRGLIPSVLGRTLQPHAEAAERAVQAAQHAAATSESGPSGTVRIACTEGMATWFLARRLPELLTPHPRLSVHLQTSTDLADLRHDEADLALRFVQPEQGELVAVKLADVPMCLATHRDLAHRRWTELPQLVLALPGETPESQWMAQHVDGAQRLSSNSVSTLLQAARAGLGVTVLSRPLVETFDELVILDGPELPSLPLWMLAHPDVRRSPRVAVVWDAFLRWAHELR